MEVGSKFILPAGHGLETNANWYRRCHRLAFESGCEVENEGPLARTHGLLVLSLVKIIAPPPLSLSLSKWTLCPSLVICLSLLTCSLSSRLSFSLPFTLQHFLSPRRRGSLSFLIPLSLSVFALLSFCSGLSLSPGPCCSLSFLVPVSLCIRVALFRFWNRPFRLFFYLLPFFSGFAVFLLRILSLHLS